VLVTRSEAMRQANAYLSVQSVSPTAYQSVAWLEDNVDTLAEKYLLQFRSVQETDRLYRKATKLALWHVRYFKPLQKEEYLVFVDPEGGGVFGMMHELDEDTPGASLTPEEALDLGRRFVARQGFNLADYDLQDSHQEKRKARTDYTLTWQARAGNPLNVGEAYYRLELDIAGDQPVGFSHLFKLPEAWGRQQGKHTLANYVDLMIKVILIGGLLGGAVWLFVYQVRRNQLRWRQTLLLSVAVGALALLAQINALALVKSNYPTAYSMSTFNLFVVVGFLFVFLVVTLAAWVATAFAVGLYPNSWGVFETPAKRTWARDAAVVLVLAIVLGAGVDNLSTAFLDHFHAYASAGGAIVNPALAVPLPGVDFYLGALARVVFAIAVLAVPIYLVNLGWRKRSEWLWAGVVLLLASLGSWNAHSAGEFLTSWLVGLAPLLVAFVVLAFFTRDNVSAYLAVAFSVSVLHPLITLLRDPVRFYRLNGVVLAALVTISLGWLLWPRGPQAAVLAVDGVRTLPESSPFDSGR
jgi:hypothetical protein